MPELNFNNWLDLVWTIFFWGSAFVLALGLIVLLGFGVLNLAEWAWDKITDIKYDQERRRRAFDAAAIVHKFNTETPADVEEEWNRRNGI
jgi:hypothetical protein